MTSTTIPPQPQFNQDEAIWSSLKQAIVKSSGFQRWQGEQESKVNQKQNTDTQVRRYLEETLETLAY